MAKISMLIPDEALAEIDAQAGGNRTAFMLAAAIDRARKLRRESVDREIAANIVESAEHDAQLYSEWETTLGDGLE
jgi:hypothetical protein